MYIFRAYQSPCSGTHCGLQCAQIPNFASRNQSGQRYDFRDSQNGRNGPSGTSPRKKGESPAALAIADNASALAPLSRNDRRFKIAYLLQSPHRFHFLIVLHGNTPKRRCCAPAAITAVLNRRSSYGDASSFFCIARKLASPGKVSRPFFSTSLAFAMSPTEM